MCELFQAHELVLPKQSNGSIITIYDRIGQIIPKTPSSAYESIFLGVTNFGGVSAHLLNPDLDSLRTAPSDRSSTTSVHLSPQLRNCSPGFPIIPYSTSWSTSNSKVTLKDGRPCSLVWKYLPQAALSQLVLTIRGPRLYCIHSDTALSLLIDRVLSVGLSRYPARATL